MKTVIISALVLFASLTCDAQTFEYFFKARPKMPVFGSNTMSLVPGAPGESRSWWEFKPTFQVSAWKISKSEVPGKTLESTWLDAAGPGLTFQHATQNLNGENYADYAVSVVVLMSGSSVKAPNIALAVPFGLFNNLIQVGPGYDFSGSKVFGIINVGVNISNN